MFEAILSLCIMGVTLLTFYYFRPHMRPLLMAADTTPRLGTRPSNEPKNLTQIAVKSVQNPFSIELTTSTSSAKDGVYFKVKSTVYSFNMAVAWCVNINNFYKHLEKTPHEMFFSEQEEEEEGGGRGENDFLYKQSSKVEYKKFNLDELNEIDMHYPVPWQCAEKFKSSEEATQTRDFFQLVIALYHEKTKLESLSQQDIAANIWIVHLKDQKLDTKRIFANDSENLCVVCRTNPSNQVLLPCNHNCLCQECIERVSLKCPMCRTQIQSKFQI